MNKFSALLTFSLVLVSAQVHGGEKQTTLRKSDTPLRYYATVAGVAAVGYATYAVGSLLPRIFVTR